MLKQKSGVASDRKEPRFRNRALDGESPSAFNVAAETGSSPFLPVAFCDHADLGSLDPLPKRLTETIKILFQRLSHAPHQQGRHRPENSNSRVIPQSRIFKGSKDLPRFLQPMPPRFRNRGSFPVPPRLPDCEDSLSIVN